jgi:hypothetical protein
VGSTSKSSVIFAAALGQLVPYSAANAFAAVSACSRSSAFQISASSAFAPGWADFSSALRTLAILGLSAIAKDLKPVYTAPSVQAALDRFAKLPPGGRSATPAIIRHWENA